MPRPGAEEFLSSEKKRHQHRHEEQGQTTLRQRDHPAGRLGRSALGESRREQRADVTQGAHALFRERRAAAQRRGVRWGGGWGHTPLLGRRNTSKLFSPNSEAGLNVAATPRRRKVLATPS